MILTENTEANKLMHDEKLAIQFEFPLTSVVYLLHLQCV
jgi:hypothetical protein